MRMSKLFKRLHGGKVAVVVVTGSAVLGQFAAAGGPASASGPAGARLSRLAPRIPVGASAIGAQAASTPIDLSVALAPRDEAALTSFIAATSTPGSPSYRHYLAPGQFASRFGPTSTTIAAVQDELRSLGIPATTLSSDHLFVNAATTAATVESAFRVQLQRYRMSDGTVGFSNTDAPLVSGVLASSAVNGILGMDTLTHPRPLLARSPRAIRFDRDATSARSSLRADASGPQACMPAASAATASDSYTDTQIAQAYELSNLYADGATGANQTIALYELEPYSSTDLTAFQNCYGTSVSVTNINEFGGPGTGAGSGESILDVENMVALAPGAKILVYQAPSAATDSQAVDLYDDMVEPDNAKQLSTSWGTCELDESTSVINSEAPIFQEAAADGETFYAAAGDDGSEDCLEDGTSNDSKLAVDDPASQQYVVSVGGVRLETLTPTEAVWNDHGDGEGAGGGGISTRWLMPSWQTGTGVINNFSSGTSCDAGSGNYCREVPDVSGDADPDEGGWVFYFDGAWDGGEGGASAAAPMWAALTAVIASQCEAALGFVAPRLYEVASDAGNFTDVTSGNNDYTDAHGGDYPATAGYDLASGLGSPLATGLATSLCPSSVLTSPSLSVTAPSTDTAASPVAASSIGGVLAGGSSPAGTISFLVFGPQSSPPSSCTSGGTAVGTASVSGNGTYHPSASLIAPAAGDYWWYADYGGDAHNNPAASACGASMAETVITAATPAVSVSAPSTATAGVATASASIDGVLAGGASPTGTISFQVFGPQPSPPLACTSGGATVGTASVSGNGTYHPSAVFTPPAAGDYWWYANYGGDANNNRAASACRSLMSQTVAARPSGGSGGSAAVRLAGSPKATADGVTLKLVCSAPAGQKCQTTSTFETASGTSKKHGRAVVVAQKSTSIPAGRTATIAVTLNGQGQRLLKRIHKLAVTLTVTVPSDGKTTVALTDKLTIKQQKKKKKKKRGG